MMTTSLNLTEQLKEATKKIHAKTETAMDAKALFSPFYTIEAYRLHLTHLYKAHTLAFELISNNENLLPTASLLPENRCADLKQDLNLLNCATEPIISMQVNDFELELAHLIGLIYVVKGSELGGHIISKQIEKHHTRWELPAAHFYKLVDEVSLRVQWIQWCKTANQYGTDQEFIDKAIEGALLGFELFNEPERYLSTSIAS